MNVHVSLYASFFGKLRSIHPGQTPAHILPGPSPSRSNSLHTHRTRPAAALPHTWETHHPLRKKQISSEGVHHQKLDWFWTGKSTWKENIFWTSLLIPLCCLNPWACIFDRFKAHNKLSSGISLEVTVKTREDWHCNWTGPIAQACHLDQFPTLMTASPCKYKDTLCMLQYLSTCHLYIVKHTKMSRKKPIQQSINLLIAAEVLSCNVVATLCRARDTELKWLLANRSRWLKPRIRHQKLPWQNHCHGCWHLFCLRRYRPVSLHTLVSCDSAFAINFARNRF